MSIISRDNTAKPKKKKIRLDSRFWARVLVVFLALAMLAGTFYYVIVFTMAGSHVDAVEVAEDDPSVRIALIYGSSVTVDFLTVADYGFSLGFTDSENDFTELLSTDLTTLHVAQDRNLRLDNGRYVISTSVDTTDIGSYHIQIACEDTVAGEWLAELRAAYPHDNVFPAYYDGAAYIMMGHYATEALAQAALTQLLAELPPETTEPETTDTAETELDSLITETRLPETTESSEESSADPDVTDADRPVSDTSITETTVSPDTTFPETTIPETMQPNELIPNRIAEAIRDAAIMTPSATAVVVIDPATNTIVWEFDQKSSTSFLALKAHQNGSTYSYIKGYKNGTRYTYDGVLECSVYKTEEYDGIKVINILPLETYIAGVIPYEIGNSWPLETQKAFAITVRSYAIANLGRHKKSYNADLCSSADCQVYKGFGSTNARVRQAVTETKGKIAVYNATNDICITTYSSSTGGCTANAWDVWGSSRKTYGYLAAVATPWEKYTKYGNGSWTFTATGKQLYQRLEACNYTALTGAVTKIEITQFGENSTYVYAIKFYDAAGHTVEVKQGNKVKSLLSPYVNSGNFVVAKAGEQVTRTNFTMMGFGASTAEPTLGMVVKTNPYEHTIFGRQELSVLTASGKRTFSDSSSEFVATANGVWEFNMSHSLDSQFYPTVVGVNGKVLPDIMNLQTLVETETLTAEGPSGSFVFIGRGWGHGVGLSQWGMKDLGDLGYDYETIFKAYYSNVKIVDFQAYQNGIA